MLTPGDHVVEYVDAYLHDALSPEDRRYVEHHLAACRICQVALEEARVRYEVLRSVPAVEASEALIQATEKRIAGYRPRRITPMRVAWSVLAAAATILLCVHFYVDQKTPTPYDLQLFGQPKLLAASNAVLNIRLVNYSTGRPLGNVPVDVQLADQQTGRRIPLAQLTTDRFGMARPKVKLPDWKKGAYRLTVQAHLGDDLETVARDIELYRSWRLFLSTDKPVYQPGQTIHLRSLALALPNLKPVAGRTTEFAITDPRGNVIFRARDVTSRFGIASADCTTAAELAEGAYQVTCQVGDTTSKRAIEIKHYVLPKFKLSVKLDQPFYQPGQAIRGTVHARYFFGKPVAGARVRVELSTVGAVGTQRSTITAGNVSTDGDGVAHFDVRLPERLVGRPQEAGAARVAIMVTARDTAGQQQSRRVERLVTDQPIRIEVIPEAGKLVAHVPNTIYFFTSYPDGRPAKTRIIMAGMDHELETDSLGIAQLEITPKTEQVSWQIRAVDDQGRTARREVTLDCTVATDGFLIRPDKAVYASGETMRLLALGGGTEPILVDLVKDGQTMLSDRIEMSGGRGSCVVDLPLDVFGTVRLTAYRLNRDGIGARKDRVIFIQRADKLHIETRLDQSEYRPGRRAKVTFQLTGPDGKPAAGALSLTAVDEAVFSVGGNRPALQSTFFELDQQLLKPVYAIYPWTPEKRRDVSSDAWDRFQTALFARTGGTPLAASELRRALVDQYSEDSTEVLDVLERPDWETLAQRVGMPAKWIEKLREIHSSTGPLARSFVDKANAIDREKHRVQQLLFGAWVVLGVVAGAVILLWVFISIARDSKNAFWETIFVLVVIAILSSLLLPAVQSSREAARRMGAMNEVKQLWMAFDNMDDARRAQRGDTGAGGAAARLRSWFPETMLWRPELITDDQGRANLVLDLPDSITTWRLTAAAVSAEGRLGAADTPIRVFQPFFVDLNLPAQLTRNDEITVPVVVHNYSGHKQHVQLELAAADWFRLLDARRKEIDLEPNAVRSIGFRIRATRVGSFALEVSARADDVADSIRRCVEVVADGRRVERVFNGALDKPVKLNCQFPEDAIAGSMQAIVKFYPSTFSQLIEGIDAIFKRPYGCFEQTSSTTYPNVLALDYLRRTGKMMPGIEAKARQYIHLGYQRLVGFEVASGGFDWFGSPPANRVLTAYGLMEFQDMARVYDVDPRLIQRTRRWLLEQRRRDGSWLPESHAMHDNPAERSSMATLATTAYVAWAVFADDTARGEKEPTRSYLLACSPQQIEGPYTLALVANALIAMNPSGSLAAPYLDQLLRAATESADGQFVWWQQGARRRTLFTGAGTSGDIETTALACLALHAVGRAPDVVSKALAWLVARRDASGTWHSTQATILALKALLAGTTVARTGGNKCTLEVRVDDDAPRRITIPADQRDVVRQLKVPRLLSPGKHRLTLTQHGKPACGYQVVLAHHVPWDGQREPRASGPLHIEIKYDRTRLALDETVTEQVQMENRGRITMPMIVADLPVPPGFVVRTDDLDALVERGTIARYQQTARSVIVYLRGIGPSKTWSFQYRLRATMLVRAAARPARAYEYYDPDVHARSTPKTLDVDQHKEP